MSRITNYPETDVLEDNDIFILDGDDGTRIISAENVSKEIAEKSGLNDEIAELKDDLTNIEDNIEQLSIGKNLFGGLPNVYYPVFIPAGSKVTWAFSDRSELVANSFYINFYDNSKTYVSQYGAANHSGITSRTVTPSNSVDIYYIMVTASPVKPFQIEIGDTVTTFEEYIPNAKYLSVLVDSLTNKIPSSKNITVSAGSSHSSSLDKLPFHLESGETYAIYVKSDNIGSRIVQPYEYTNGMTGVGRAQIDVNKLYTYTTTREVDNLSLFVTSGTDAANLTLYAFRIDAYDIILTNLISENKTAITNTNSRLDMIDIGVRHSNFHINANSTHSSNNNRVELTVANGEYVYVLCYGLNGRGAQLFAANADTSTPVENNIMDGVIAKMKVPLNATKFGLYVGSASEATDVTFIVFKSQSVLSSFVDEHDNEYAVKLLNAKRKANSGNYNSLTSPEIFTIAHFSDIHGNVWAMKQVQNFKEIFSSYLDDVLCTGDLVVDKISDGLAFWNNNSDGKILIGIGNHDNHDSNGWGAVSQQTLYETFIEPYEDNWNADTVENHSYWYKDYADKKIRLISVDATISDSTDQAAQMTWLATALSGAKTNGYAVVGAVHFPPMPTNFQTIEPNFTALLHGAPSDMTQFAWSETNTDILDAVDSFIDDGGDFVCWLSGHTHYDLLSYDSRYPKQLFVTISIVSPVASGEERIRNRNNGTGFLLNTVCVDTVRKYVKILRYGAEWDDCLRHTGTCVVKYDANPPVVVFQN